MNTVKNVFICLVHENLDCILNLIRNLRYSDPKSKILLYNGGSDNLLLSNFPFDKYGVIVHPYPKKLQWGWLHDFAIDCMEYAIDNMEFDTITVVDSDQLLCKKNYTDFISETFYAYPDLGMFGQVAHRLPENTEIHPAITAYQEKDLWQPLLDELPNGKEAFLHWTFWPSTVFTYNASKDLVNLFRTNHLLHETLKKTKIWASEEILLPTLTIALGYKIVKNPCSYDFVKYKTEYTTYDIQKAIDTNTCYWLHPILRSSKDVNRKYLQTSLNNYILPHSIENEENHKLINSIRKKVANIEGWLEDEELELLVELAAKKLNTTENSIFLEIGSYCGKATSVISLVAKHFNNDAKIIAIDDFSGRLGAEDGEIHQYPPSYTKFQNTLSQLEINDIVSVIKETPNLVSLDEKVDFVLFDGLHDYVNVARDFYTFEKTLKSDTFILFHDYNSYFPGVMIFVTELVNLYHYKIIKHSSSLIALIKAEGFQNSPHIYDNTPIAKKQELPLVSCIMPIYDRPEFLVQAITQFLNQNYHNKELIVLDDSKEALAYLIPEHPQIRYKHLSKKMELGSKRNLACAMSKGSVILHLDDDDFYAPDWIEKSVKFLLENNLAITGLNTPKFCNVQTSEFYQYHYPPDREPWVYGATLCYTKKFWESNPFPSVSCGEDNAFVWSANTHKVLPNPNIINSYLGRIHHKNTSPKQIEDSRWTTLDKEEAFRYFKHLIAEPELKKFNNVSL